MSNTVSAALSGLAIFLGLTATGLASYDFVVARTTNQTIADNQATLSGRMDSQDKSIGELVGKVNALTPSNPAPLVPAVNPPVVPGTEQPAPPDDKAAADTDVPAAGEEQAKDADVPKSERPGPLDGETQDLGPQYDAQVAEYCNDAPEKRADGKFYLKGCHGGSDPEGTVYVCTGWDHVEPIIHGCSPILP